MAKNRMVLIATDGTRTVEEVDGRQGLYNALKCEYVEAIHGTLHGCPVALWFDEDGKQRNLAMNATATRIGHTFGMMPLDYLAGDVLVSAVDSDGETADLSDEVIDKICE